MERETLDDLLEERIWIVPADHPYCTGGYHIPDVYRVGSEWKIAWRTFDWIKQDNIYSSERQAREAARRIAEKPATASAYDVMQLKKFSELWIEAAGLPKSHHARFSFREITSARP